MLVLATVREEDGDNRLADLGRHRHGSGQAMAGKIPPYRPDIPRVGRAWRQTALVLPPATRQAVLCFKNTDCSFSSPGAASAGPLCMIASSSGPSTMR